MRPGESRAATHTPVPDWKLLLGCSSGLGRSAAQLIAEATARLERNRVRGGGRGAPHPPLCRIKKSRLEKEAGPALRADKIFV